MSERKLLVSTREAAELLQVSERTLYSLRMRGRIAFVQFNRSVLYDIEDLRRFVATCKRVGSTISDDQVEAAAA
jgi:excisionase family DNA binding protein